jgi:hypothetical protein
MHSNPVYGVQWVLKQGWPRPTSWQYPYISGTVL